MCRAWKVIVCTWALSIAITHAVAEPFGPCASSKNPAVKLKACIEARRVIVYPNVRRWVERELEIAKSAVREAITDSAFEREAKPLICSVDRTGVVATVERHAMLNSCLSSTDRAQ